MGNGVCTQCGSPADTGLIFCKKCGTTLRPPVPLNQASSQADAPRIISSSKFWLTWKEFLTVISLLFVLLVASSFGGGDDAYKASQILGSIGGIYVLLYIIRAMRAKD